MSDQEQAQVQGPSGRSAWPSIIGFSIAAIAFSCFFRIVHFSGLEAWLVLKETPALEFPYVAFPSAKQLLGQNTQLGPPNQTGLSLKNMANLHQRFIDRACSNFGSIVLHTGDLDITPIKQSGCAGTFRLTFGEILTYADKPTESSKELSLQASQSLPGWDDSLTDLSGIWSTGSEEVRLLFTSRHMVFQAVNELHQVEMQRIDPISDLVKFTLKGKDPYAAWTLARIWNDEKTGFYLLLIAPSGEQARLKHVRALTDAETLTMTSAK